MRKRKNKKQQDEEIRLADHLNVDIIDKLKFQKQILAAEEKTRKEEEAEQKREERRQREKNKSFEQLLAESELDWKNFK